MTVIVNVGFRPHATPCSAGAMLIAGFASTTTQAVFAGAPLPPVPVVARRFTVPATGMRDVAETTVVPASAEVMRTVQLEVARRPG